MKKKNIFVILGHPDDETLCGALYNSYIKGAKQSGANIRSIKLGNTKFNPNLEYGYKKRTPLEPSLIKAQKDILWADHLVIIYPTWWGSTPAILKGFIDRVFLPGFAFQYHKEDPFWDKYLKNKSAHIITTINSPKWYHIIFHKSPGIKMLKYPILKFVGISKIKITTLTNLGIAKQNRINKIIKKIENYGYKQK